LAKDARQNIVGRDWQADRGCVNFLHGGVLLVKKGRLVNTFLAKHTAFFKSPPSTRFDNSSPFGTVTV
jgi:hypothetical protein